MLSEATPITAMKRRVLWTNEENGVGLTGLVVDEFDSTFSDWGMFQFERRGKAFVTASHSGWFTVPIESVALDGYAALVLGGYWRGPSRSTLGLVEF
jgi:hypothetical protein